MLGRIVYWLAVLIVSLALVVGLILFFESRDQSQVGSSGTITPLIDRPASAPLDPRRGLVR